MERVSTKVRAEIIGGLYQQGLTQYEVAARLGISQATVSRYLARAGVEVGRNGPPPKSGSDHPAWKGDGAGYSQMHLRVSQLRGRPQLCEQCGATEGRMEWANLSGNYADPMDYKRLCRCCHMRLDEIGRKSNESRKGAPHGSQTRYRKYGCHCGICKDGNAARARRYRRAKSENEVL